MSENELNNIKEKSETNNSWGKNVIVVLLVIISIILLVLSVNFIKEGFYKKDTYYLNGSYSKNAYVGGDAYNYIINAEYFAGYVTLGGCFMISSTICVTSAIKLKLRK